ncbi:MAG: hypothetical protein ACE5ER_08040 [Nitrospinaceae bacterium]
MDEKAAGKKCAQGVTLYCLALGMQEVKQGRRREALEHYRQACERHPTVGHLRACTPLLSLAREMRRLPEAAGPLEKKCADGDLLVCFHLGKEYLKINEPERAYSNLQPLCRQGYRPPDSLDYGPCYHLAKGLQAWKQWNRARKLADLDCRRDPRGSHPSCGLLRTLQTLQAEDERKGWARLRPPDPAEGVLLVLAAISLLGAGVWLRGRRGGMQYLRLEAPLLAGLVWIAWETFPKSYAYGPMAGVVVFFCLFNVGGTALLAHQKIREQSSRRKNSRP